MPSWRVAWGDALLLALVVGAFIPALTAGFVYDDDHYVVGNELLRSARGLLQIWAGGVPGEHYWPVTYTAFWLQYQAWGAAPAGFHVVNVLLHAFNCCLIWRVLARTDLPGSWLAAAIFAVHPIHVESVAWVIELKDVLSGALYLLAFLAYMTFAETGRTKAYAAALLLFASALLSKSIVITFPLAVLLWIWVRQPSAVWRHAKALVPFVLIAGAITAIDLAWFSEVREAVPLTWVDRSVIAGGAFWFSLWKLVLPIGLSQMYAPWPVDPLAFVQWGPLMLAAAAAALLFVLLWRRSWTRSAAAMIFFGITLGPALGFVYHAWMRYAYVADRFLYLASIGPIALAAAAFSRAAGGKFARGVRFGAWSAIAVLAALTWRQAAKYENAQTFYESLLVENPRAWFAHVNLGVLLVDQGAVAQGIEHYREALRLNPDHFDARVNLGVALAATGRGDEALENLEKARALRPGDSDVHNFIGLTLANGGRLADAIPYYEVAVRLQPSNADALNNLGVALGNLGRRAEAIAAFEAAIKAVPSHYLARENLASQLYLEGRTTEALRQRQEAQYWRALASGGQR